MSNTEDQAAQTQAAQTQAAQTQTTPVAGASAPDNGGHSKVKRQRPSMHVSTALVRTRVGQLLWAIAVIAALFLAVGALLVALDANEANELVDFVVSGADVADLGIFSRREGQGIFDFSGENADTKRTLVNWGLGAVAWLVAGKLAERIVRG